MFVQVVVNRPIHQRPSPGDDPVRGDQTRLASLTYRVPDRLLKQIVVGHLVQVPLRTSTALGAVVELRDIPPKDLPAESIRDIAEILDPLPIVTPTQIELAAWVSTHYLAPLNQAMRLMLPPGLEERTFVVVTQTDDQAREAAELPDKERAALQVLQKRGGRMRMSTLLNQIHTEDPEAVIHALTDRGLVDARYTLVPPKPAPPRLQFVRLVADDATIEAALPRLGRASKQADLLLMLARHADAPLTLAELCERAGCKPTSVRALARASWLEITERRSLVMALSGADTAALERAPKQQAVLTVLLNQPGPIEKTELLTQAGASARVLTALEDKGLAQGIVQEPVVLLKLSPAEAIEEAIKIRGGEKERAVLDLLRGTTGRVWVGGIYAQTGANLATLRKLADRGLVSLHAEDYERPRLTGPSSPPTLTPEQDLVLHEIARGMEQQAMDSHPYAALLHGVTGSGKTEIYLNALETVLTAGKRGIILVPEISLTPQTVRRFEARFPGRVAMMHSQLTLGQRYAVWDRVRRGKVDVLIGPRSTLLAPMPRLGLVVLDESHDDSYKQTEPIPLPAYHARDTALALGRLTGATVLLGTATPDLVTYYRAKHGTCQILELPHRIQPAAASDTATTAASRYTIGTPPPVRIVDLRQELYAGNRSIFSRALQAALSRTLDAGEQAILFLNRRGSATFVLCRDCGYVARCPRCEVPLTFHHLAPRSPSGQGRLPGGQKLVCHRCNYREPAPVSCPECGRRRIRYFGLGTERVEETVRELFSQARPLRWDWDTAIGPDHERHLQAFLDRRANVLIGTQMIAKGLDLPLVTLVGVVSADTALFLPDFRAAERTFQLLTHVAGRAGRSQRGGQVIIQTYNPEHYAIQFAARHDYAGFCDQELALRRQLGYPPFSRLMALRFSSKKEHRARVEAHRLGRWLAQESLRLGLAADLIGPAPCFFSRVQGRYRWQIVIRAQDPSRLLENVALPWGWRVDVDPASLL